MKPRRIVSDSIARLIDPEVRAELGITTAEESIAEAVHRSEKAEHKIFSDWCRLHDIPCREDRMDRATSTRPGWPDCLIIFQGRAWLMELKVGNNKVTDAQRELIAQLVRTGTDVAICYSADQAIRKLRAWLWEHFRWEPKS